MSSNNHKRQRRRGEALEGVLLDAAWAQLNEVGYEKFNFEDVANRANTSKAVLYRRWANRLELVHELLRSRQPLVSDFTPSGDSLRAEVMELLTHMALGMDEARMAIQWGLFVDVITSDKRRTYLYDEVIKSNMVIMQKVIEKARLRNEDIAAVIPDRVLVLPFTLMRHELIMTGRAPTQSAIEQIVDDVFVPLVKG
jgi:AcrR family transcriptional regulator